jgi:hypothetical protein
MSGRTGGRCGVVYRLVYVWQEVQFVVLFVTCTDGSSQLHVGT